MAQKASKQGTGVEFRYSIAEKCYAMDRNRTWYRAVIRNAYEHPASSASYFVHYHGSNERANEWIFEDCLMKVNDEKSDKKAKEENERAAAESKKPSKALPKKGTKKAPRSRANTLNTGGEGISIAASRSEPVVSESASDAIEGEIGISVKRQQEKDSSQAPAEVKKAKTQMAAASSTLTSTPAAINPAVASASRNNSSATVQEENDASHAAQPVASNPSTDVTVSDGNDANKPNEDAYAPLAFAAHAVGVLQALQKNRTSDYRQFPTDFTLYGKKQHGPGERSGGYAVLDDGGISAHKCVLETQSLFFAERYAYKDPGKSENKLEINLDQDILRFIIDFVYTGKVPDFEQDFPGEDATVCCKRLLAGAETLQLTSSSVELVKFCQRWLLKPPISNVTCLSQLLYAAKYGLPAADTENYRMLNRAMMFFAAAMPEIMDSEEFSSVNGVYLWKIYEMVRNKHGKDIRFDLGDRKICIEVVTMCNTVINVMCSPDCSVKKLTSWLREACEFFVSARMIYEGRRLAEGDILRGWGIRTGDVLFLTLEQVGCACECSASKAKEAWAKTSPELGAE